MKPLSEYESAIIVFDDIFVSSNSRYINQFFIRERYNNLGNSSLPQSHFDLPKRSIRKNSNKLTLFNQTLKYLENLFRGVRGYDMSYDEFEQ